MFIDSNPARRSTPTRQRRASRPHGGRLAVLQARGSAGEFDDLMKFRMPRPRIRILPDFAPLGAL